MQTEILATRTWVRERLNGVTDPYAFTVSTSGTVIGYNVSYGDRVIMPPEIRGITPTKIIAGTFNMNTGLIGSYTDKGVSLIAGPKHEVELDDYVFAGCTSLTSVLLYGNKPAVGINIFGDLSLNQVIVYRLAGTTGWESTLSGMLVVEVDDFDSVLAADKPLYLHDTVTKRIHEIRITNSSVNSGLIQ